MWSSDWSSPQVQPQFPTPIQQPGPGQRFEGATRLRTDPVPPVSQPVFNYEPVQQMNRFIVAAPPQIHQGATKQQQYLFPPYQPQNANIWSWLSSPYYQQPDATGPVIQTAGPVPQQTFPVPPISQPVFNYYITDPNHRMREGSTPQLTGAVVQATFVFPVSQPEIRQFLSLNSNRYIAEQTKRFEGAIQVQTYIFPVSNPEFSYYLKKQPANTPSETRRPVTEGATSQQTFEFKVSQPELIRYYLYNTFSGIFRPIENPAGVPQTYLFPVSQPEMSYILLNGVRYQVPVTPRFEQKAPLFPVPPVSQPELNHFELIAQAIRNNPQVTKILEGFTPPLTVILIEDRISVGTIWGAQVPDPHVGGF